MAVLVFFTVYIVALQQTAGRKKDGVHNIITVIHLLLATSS